MEVLAFPVRSFSATGTARLELFVDEGGGGTKHNMQLGLILERDIVSERRVLLPDSHVMSVHHLRSMMVTCAYNGQSVKGGRMLVVQ